MLFFQNVLLNEAYRPAIDRVTETPNLLMNMSREHLISMETRHRAVRHAAQIHARRMNEELASLYESVQPVPEEEYELQLD